MKLIIIALCLILPVIAYSQYISNNNFSFTTNGLKVDASGSVAISGAVQAQTYDAFGNPISSAGGALNVNLPNSSNVTVTASVLPTGAATEATLFAFDSKFSTTSNGIKVDGSSVTQPVSIASLPSQNVTVTAMPAVTQGTSPWVSSVNNFPSSQNVVVTSIPTITAQSASNLNGSMVNLTTTVTPQVVTAPANAVGFNFESDSSNTSNVRYAVGATASASVGTLMEPGRDSGYIPSGANISVISISGSPTVSVQWIQR